MPLARLAVSAAGGAAFLLLQHIQVPLLDLRIFGGDVPAAVSVGALGLEPIVIAWIAVEIATVLMPRWRSLRATNSAALDRASVALAVVIAVVEAVESARGFERLTAGADRIAGIGRGLSILLAADALSSLPAIVVRYRREEFGPRETVALVVAIGGTMLILAARGLLRLPVSGLDPVLRPLGLSAVVRAVYRIKNLPVRWLVRGGVIISLTATLGYLFNAKEGPARRAALPSAIAGTVVYLVVMKLLLVYFPIDFLGLATAAAVAMDIGAELRLETVQGKLVAVRRIQKPDHARDLIESLREAGVPAVGQGAFHRTLLQFFGPFIPVDILVPAARATQASAVLDAA